MVQVRIVRMRVDQRVVPVQMGSRLVALSVVLVSMLVVLVMNMRVRMLQKKICRLLAQHDHGKGGAEERGHGVTASSRGLHG